jgi:hypothetical protein
MLCRRSARVGSDKSGADISFSKETLHNSKAQKNS